MLSSNKIPPFLFNSCPQEDKDCQGTAKSIKNNEIAVPKKLKMVRERRKAEKTMNSPSRRSSKWSGNGENLEKQ